MKSSFSLRKKAISLRKRGFSLSEISTQLSISKSTSSLWVRTVSLNQLQQERLLQLQAKGRIAALKLLKQRRDLEILELSNSVIKELQQISLKKSYLKLLTALFIWTEGIKHTQTFVGFINSDPVLIQTFLKVFRSSFNLDEKKFRALVHVHTCQDDISIREFWSATTEIPLSQFSKSFTKKNTGKIKRSNYKGCLRIRYYDAKIAKELKIIYNRFAQNLLGPVVQR